MSIHTSRCLTRDVELADLVNIRSTDFDSDLGNNCWEPFFRRLVYLQLDAQQSFDVSSHLRWVLRYRLNRHVDLDMQK